MKFKVGDRVRYIGPSSILAGDFGFTDISKTDIGIIKIVSDDWLKENDRRLLYCVKFENNIVWFSSYYLGDQNLKYLVLYNEWIKL